MSSKRRMTASAQQLEVTEDSPRLTLPISEKRDHIQGPTTAKVVLVEYGDYQCPYCGEAYPIVKKIQEKHGNSLRFVFRNFPLTQIHPRAEFGAEFAEAAAAGGKFWEMHDFIYENQRSLDDEEFFLKFADKKLGLDKEKIHQSVVKRAFEPRIREDFMSGVRSGVNGTPTFFIKEHRHNGSYEFKALDEAIISAIDQKP
jgi:protein-disulfide isomerase